IRTHGKSAYRTRLPALLADGVQEHFAHESRSGGVERGGAAVNVVIARAPRGELELAETERFAGENAEQLLAGVVHEWFVPLAVWTDHNISGRDCGSRWRRSGRW